MRQESRTYCSKCYERNISKHPRPLKGVFGSEHQTGTQTQSCFASQSPGTETRLTKKTATELKGPPTPTPQRALSALISPGLSSSACHRLNKPSLFQGRKRRLPPRPRGSPSVAFLHKIKTGKDSNASGYSLQEEFAWGEWAARDRPQPPCIRRSTRDYLHSPLSPLERLRV